MRHLLLIILSILTFTNTAFADSFNDTPLLLQPAYPKPNEEVTASIQSYAYDLQKVPITWSIDGEVVAEGQGLTKVSFTAPGLGSSIKLTVLVGDSITTSRNIAPTTVDLLWEANTYTPAHYLGRALPVDSSQITAVAIPQIGDASADASALIYNWYKGSRFITNASGVGKSTLTTNSPGLYDDYNLYVEVTDSSGIVMGSNGVKITTVEPELILYNTSPILGAVLHSALSAASSGAVGIESSVVAIPYHFGIRSPQELYYRWLASNMQYQQDSSQGSITITKVGNDAHISVEAQHQSVLLQSAVVSYRYTDTELEQDGVDTEGIYQSPFGSSDN